jgi:hypothetical protein
MKFKKTTKIKNFLIISFGIFVSFFLLNFPLFVLGNTWSPTTSIPPQEDALGFLNTSATTQLKNAGLEIQNIFEAFTIKLNPGTSTQPTCDSQAEGMMWLQEGGVGESDEVMFCIKNESDAYAWEVVEWWEEEDCSTVAIGEACGGGIVAYHDGSGGGLIAPAADNSTGVEWGCEGTEVGASGTSIGTGASNTSTILAGCATRPIAASVCSTYDGGGYDDWFLPSQDELNQLYTNRVSIGGFQEAHYWSSSESDADDARFQFFNNGNQYNLFKHTTSGVRCVRAF